MTTERMTTLRSRLGPLTLPGFAFYWSARTVSLIGDYAFRVAFITYIISTTHRSALSLAVANAVLLVPALVFYAFGGVLGDRVASRRHVMIASDLGRCAAVAAIAACVSLHAPIAVVVACAVSISVGDGFFMPASFAYFAEIVPPDRLAGANSSISLSQQAGLILGPLLGGLLIGFGGATVAFAFDSGTFLASAVFVALISASLTSRQADGENATADAGTESEPPGILAEIKGGLSYVRAQQWLLISCAVGAIANAVFAGNLDVTVPLIVSPHGTSDARFLGIFYALEGAGAVAGAIIMTRVPITRAGQLIFVMMAGMAVSLTLVGVFHRSAGTYVMALTYGVGLHFFNSLYTTLVQEKVPGSLMSRVGSLLFLAFNGLMPLGTLIMGPLILVLGASSTAIVTSAVVGVVCLAATVPASIRRLTIGAGASS